MVDVKILPRCRHGTALALRLRVVIIPGVAERAAGVEVSRSEAATMVAKDVVILSIRGVLRELLQFTQQLLRAIWWRRAIFKQLGWIVCLLLRR